MEVLTKEQQELIEKKVAEALEKAKVERKFTPSAGNPAGEGVTKDPADQPFASLGEQLKAIASAGHGGSPIREPRLRRCIDGAIDPVTKAPTGLGESVPSDGAFLIAQEFIPNMINRIYNTGQVITRCAKQPVGANFNGFKIPAINETSRADGSRWGGVQAYWGAEAATITASAPKFRQISVELQKLFGLCYVTDELLQDSVALEGYVMQWFPMEFGFKLDDAIINGDGAGKPLGILNSPATVSVAKETNQAGATVVTQNVLKMFRRMWAPSWPNAIWFINQELLDQLLTLTIPIGTAGALASLYGGNAYVPPGLSAPGNSYGTGNQAPYGSILGRPVIPIEQCAAAGTVGDIILVDLSQYIVGEKGGLNAATSIHVSFTTDQTAFRFIYRVNGQPIWHSALTPFKGSGTLSPYVSLATRS